MKHLAPLAPMMRALGDADQRYVLDAEIFQGLAHARHLPLATVDQHEAGPGIAVAIGILFDRPREAATHDFAHHREIVIGLRLADVELAILVLEEALGPGDDHRPDRLGPLDMAVVVDFDPA